MALLPTSIPANFTTVALSGDLNNTHGPDCPGAESAEWHYTVLPVYILLVSVLGMVLNAFVLMVFCFHKKACTVAEIYLSNMAIADLVLMTCLPFWAVYAAKKFNWPFPTPLCTLVTLSINMNAYCSIYFLVLISIDRFLALVHPLSHEQMRRPICAKLACMLVWGFGLLMGVPTLVYRDVKYFPHINSTPCYLNYPNTHVQLTFDGMLMMFGFIIPVSIISYCTFKIIKALQNRSIDALNTRQTEHKATTLVLAVLLAFMICWVPYHLIKIPNALIILELLTCDVLTIVNTCSHVFMYFAFFNSVLNPILYVIVGKNFQKKVRELFKRQSFDRSTSYTRSNLTRSVKRVAGVLEPIPADMGKRRDTAWTGRQAITGLTNRDNQPFKLSFTHGKFRVVNVFGLWEEPSEPGENPR
ncbi:B2 bradykinin receptor-like isoform X1 [Epinephelus lanceolatus]|uniref:B2 bradykinin receptor-like n=1 Tax=Epinephelus lanceolatus TaxID=310571 RepID=UPI001447AE05|nr:B2 bradykinin receptor-like [Epinephelus lanceolatus]